MHPLDEGLDEEGWDVRETFAHFGRAFYAASVFEVGLSHSLMFAEFMMEERVTWIASKGKAFDRKEYEARFDAYMDHKFSQTMGNIIKKVESLSIFGAELTERIKAAKRRRDFLSHHYWRERSIDFASFEGRRKLRAELDEDAILFIDLDRDVDAALATVRKQLGIDEELVAAQVQKMIEKLKHGQPFDE